MKRYILTLAPEDGTGTSAVALIDVNAGRPRLKQITFTAADGDYLPQMPFDIEGFIAAVMPGTTTPPAAAQPVVRQPVAMNVPSREAAITRADASAAAAVVTSDRVTKPATPTDRQATTVKKAATAPRRAATGAVSNATAPKKTAAKKTAAKKTVAVTASDTKAERAYNKMPDDFVQTYGKTTLADLATVYEVPLHTVTGWVKTARRQGFIPPAKPRKNA